MKIKTRELENTALDWAVAIGQRRAMACDKQGNSQDMPMLGSHPPHRRHALLRRQQAG